MEKKNNYYSYQINRRYIPFEGKNYYNVMAKQNRNLKSADISYRQNEDIHNTIKELRKQVQEISDTIKNYTNNTDEYLKNKRNNLKNDRNYSMDVMRSTPHQDGLLGETIKVLNGYKNNYNSPPYEYNTLNSYYKNRDFFNDRYKNTMNENDRAYKELNNIFKKNQRSNNTISRYLTKNNYNSIDKYGTPNKAFNFNIRQNFNIPSTNISYNFTKSSNGSNITNILKKYSQKAYNVKKYEKQNPKKITNEQQNLVNENDQLKNKVILTNNQNKYYQSQLQNKELCIQKLKDEINSLIKNNNNNIPLDD